MRAGTHTHGSRQLLVLSLLKVMATAPSLMLATRMISTL